MLRLGGGRGVDDDMGRACGKRGRREGGSAFSLSTQYVLTKQNEKLVANVIFVGEMMCTAIVTMN